MSEIRGYNPIDGFLQVVSAKDNDYVMVDMKTDEEEAIDLGAKRYNLYMGKHSN